MISESTIDAAVREMFAGITFPKEPAGLYDPLRYMIDIGGKRVRPKLCLTAYSLFKDSISDEIIEPARALEVFHSFTLMHDDIMDRSPMRRSRPTVWKQWNEDTAILSGDVMLIDAYRRIAKCPSPSHSNVLELFTQTAARVCEGQQLDMEFESCDTVSMAQYESMIGLKTAVLLACAAKMGGLIAGADSADCDALYNYGYKLGMAFQVADDYLDAFGDEKVFGKPIGGDIINCKKSWLTVHACEKAGDAGRVTEPLEADASTPEQKAAKIERVKGIYVALGVDKDAARTIHRYSDEAKSALSNIKLNNVRMEVLYRFCDNLVGRVK